MANLFFLLAAFVLLTAASASAEETKHPRGYDDVGFVQEILYELGYDIDKVDGVMGPNTGRAIAAWRQRRGYERASYLTSTQMTELRQIARETFPRFRRWSAISVSLHDGEYGFSWNRLTRSSAVLVAKRRCQKSSKDPMKCLTTSASSNAWIAAVQCRDRTRRYVGLAHSTDSGERSEQIAMDAARENGFTTGRCSLLTMLEPGGPSEFKAGDSDIEPWWEE